MNKNIQILVKSKAFAIVIPITLICGCASTPGGFRSFYSLSPAVEENSNIVQKIKEASLTEVCINKAKKEDGASTYVCEESVLFEDNANPLTNAFNNCSEDDKDNVCRRARNDFIDLAVRVADTNCNEFRERIFAKRTGANIATGVIRDSMSVGGAATAFGAPATSVGMSLSGLLIGSYDKTNQELFSNKTAQVFDKAIEQAMTTYYKELLQDNCAIKDYKDCSINRAINLTQQYSSMCGIRSALLTIEKALKTENISEKVATKAAENAAERKTSELVNTTLDTKVTTAVSEKIGAVTTNASNAKTVADNAKNEATNAKTEAANAKTEAANAKIEAANAKAEAVNAKAEATSAVNMVNETKVTIKSLCNALMNSSDNALKSSLSTVCQ